MRKNKAAIVFAICLATIITSFTFHSVPRHDFIEYWTAAHALLKRQNPYSLDLMRQLQQPLSQQNDEVLMVVSPPQFLPFVLPLGFVQSYLFARILWLVLSVGALVLGITLLWDLYGGDSDRLWIGLCVSALFFPVWHCLAVAQIGPLLLLGVAGFLWLERQRRPYLAGAALALTTAKPHLVYLIWLVLLFWSITKRDIRILAGAMVSILLALTAVLLLDPAAISQYVDLARTGYVWTYVAGAGGLLRSWLGPEKHLLQFVPMLPGLAALAYLWLRHESDWDWRDRMPLLLTISVLTSAYGWPFDEVVLLVPVLMLAAKCVVEVQARGQALLWLILTFVATLLVVLGCGDAAGMVVCATSVLGYLTYDATHRAAKEEVFLLQVETEAE